MRMDQFLFQYGTNVSWTQILYLKKMVFLQESLLEMKLTNCR